MTNINLYPDTFDQEVERESRYFDALRSLAESESADPGEEFTIEVELVPVTGYFGKERSILVREVGSTLGVLPDEDVDTWWPLACAMFDAEENLETTARIWTSKDWETNFYASVRLALPSVEEAHQEISDDSVTLSKSNLAAHETFTNELVDYTVPAWRKAHGMTEQQYQAEVEKTRQRLIDHGYQFDSAGLMTTSPSHPGLQADPHARGNALTEYQSARKGPVLTWVLWLLLGSFGAHRYYFGDAKQGIFMTIAGFIGWVPGLVWALIDAFAINRRLRELNAAKWAEIAARYGIPVEPRPDGA